MNNTIECLIAEASTTFARTPMKTPFGIKKCHVVYYNCLLGHGIKKENAQLIMKRASQAHSTTHSAAKHLVTKQIMQDAIKKGGIIDYENE